MPAKRFPIGGPDLGTVEFEREQEEAIRHARARGDMEGVRIMQRQLQKSRAIRLGRPFVEEPELPFARDVRSPSSKSHGQVRTATRAIVKPKGQWSFSFLNTSRRRLLSRKP